jgi:hypothetical protein
MDERQICFVRRTVAVSSVGNPLYDFGSMRLSGNMRERGLRLIRARALTLWARIVARFPSVPFPRTLAAD